MSSPMWYGTVCSGIECVSVAVERAGVDWCPAFFSEIEPFPCRVLAHHYPEVPNLGDMSLIADRIRREGSPACDILIAGTPCQDFSIAGLRAGMAGSRGNLTMELLRILNEIDALRLSTGMLPATLLWENVPGVLSHKDNPFGNFLAGLVGSDAAIPGPIDRHGKRKSWPRAGLVRGPQRAAAWRILDAQFFGVPQRRERLFVVAGAGNTFDPAEILFEPEGVRRHSPPRRQAQENVAAPLTAGSPGGSGYRNDIAAVDNLIPITATTLRARDNARGVDSDCTDTLIPVAFGGNNQAGPIDIATARSSSSSPHGRLDFETETFVVTSVTGDRTHALNTANNGKGSSEDGTGRGVPIIAFDSRQEAVSSEHRFGALGSSSPQAQAIAFDTTQITSPLNYSNPKPGDPCHPLAALAHPPALVSRYGVRRIMPVEAERLQGLPDRYTDVPHGNKPAADGPRYKAIGNGMAVPVIAWLLKRIDKHLKDIA